MGVPGFPGVNGMEYEKILPNENFREKWVFLGSQE